MILFSHSQTSKPTSEIDGGSSCREVDRSWLGLCGKLFVKPLLVVMHPDSGKCVLLEEYDCDHTTSRRSALTSAAVPKYRYTEPIDEKLPLLVDGRSTRPIRNAKRPQLKLRRRQFGSTQIHYGLTPNLFRRICA